MSSFNNNSNESVIPIPPFLCETPPPPPDDDEDIEEEEEEEEFGDFTSSSPCNNYDLKSINETSSSCESSPYRTFPLPPSHLEIEETNSQQGWEEEEVSEKNEEEETKDGDDIKNDIINVIIIETDDNRPCKKNEEEKIEEETRQEEVDLKIDDVKEKMIEISHVDNINCIEESEETTKENEFFAFKETEEDSLDEKKVVTNDDHYHKEEVEEEDEEDDEDDFDDFVDFKQQQQNINQNETATTKDEESEEEHFTSFVTSSTTIPLVSRKEEAEEAEEEEDAFKKAEKLLKESFIFITTEEETNGEEEVEEEEKQMVIMEQLKDVTDTPALKLKWRNSHSEKLLLKSLGIDERNIMPCWSTTSSNSNATSAALPIFAANLSARPLEPLKTAASPVVNSNSSSNYCAGIKEDEEVEEESIKEVKIEKEEGEKEIILENLDLSYFTNNNNNASHSTNNDNNSIIINNDNNYDWLGEFNISEGKDKSPKNEERKEEEFGDYVTYPPSQSPTPSLPSSTPSLPSSTPSLSSSAPSLPPSTPSLPPSTPSLPPSTPSLPPSAPSIPESAPYAPLSPQRKTNEDLEEEFTDFQSPPPPPPLLLLQPTPIEKQTKIGTSDSKKQSKIDWPEPGIVNEEEEEELKKIEMTFSCFHHNDVRKKTNEDHEWSDFVSAAATTSPSLHNNKQKSGSDKRTSSPLNLNAAVIQQLKQSRPPSLINNKQRSSDNKRTSSPDLPLSVLNLNTSVMQPTKQPVIPVITTHGLLQTKLSANIAPPITHFNHTSTSFNSSTINKSNMADILSISNQLNTSLMNNESDEEWGEFVSNALPNDPVIMTNDKKQLNKDVNNFVRLPDLDFVTPKKTKEYQQQVNFKSKKK